MPCFELLAEYEMTNSITDHQKWETARSIHTSTPSHCDHPAKTVQVIIALHTNFTSGKMVLPPAPPTHCPRDRLAWPHLSATDPKHHVAVQVLLRCCIYSRQRMSG